MKFCKINVFACFVLRRANLIQNISSAHVHVQALATAWNFFFLLSSWATCSSAITDYIYVIKIIDAHISPNVRTNLHRKCLVFYGTSHSLTGAGVAMDTHTSYLVASDWFINKGNECKTNSNEDMITTIAKLSSLTAKFPKKNNFPQKSSAVFGLFLNSGIKRASVANCTCTAQWNHSF